MQVGELGEFGLIERLLAQLGEAGAGIALGAGDDAAAIIPTPGMLLLATCDCQVEDRHFRRDQISPEQLGRRLAAVNLSDIAAMGGLPRWALVSLCLPPATQTAFVDGLYRGLAAELGSFGAQIVGGNLAAGALLTLDLTLLGEVAPAELMGRGGARVGDAVLVTGSLGSSAAGRAALEAGLTSAAAQRSVAAHLTPQPRVPAGRAIAAGGLATAMIDVSDGFAQDLGHICDASATAAVVTAAALPITPETLAVAEALGVDPMRWALGGGEDYELILTAPERSASDLVEVVEREAGVILTRIGTIVPPGDGRWLERVDGSRVPLTAAGWEHFAPGSERV